MFQFPEHIDRSAFEKEAFVDPQGRWSACRLNRLHLVGGEGDPPERFIVRDDTLRSGANTPRVLARREDRLRIAEKLEAMGVPEAEAGYGSIPEDLELIRELKRGGTRLKLGVHTRYYDDNYRDEVNRTIDAGTDVVNLVGYQGYVMTQALNPRFRGQAVLDRMAECIHYTKRQGLFTAIGTDYHNLDLVAQAVRTMAEAGADRIVVYDGRGWFTPETCAFLVKLVRALAGPGVQVGIHCHDDYGLATANTLAAVRAGAVCGDLTVNSTGHRCGNAALEQVVVALEVLYGVPTGIDLSQIYGLSKFVEEVYKVPIPANRPIVGAHMYTYGGSHIAGILKGDWYLWENVRAETVGHPGRTVLFGHTGLRRGPTGPLARKVEAMGLKATPGQMEELYRRVGGEVHKKVALTESEVEALIREVIR